jgi:phosphate uptake regulator
LAASVIAGDDDIDRRYQEIEGRAIDLMGRQQPSSDLRLLVALIHVALHLERIGDGGRRRRGHAIGGIAFPMLEVLHRLRDMGRAAASMTDTAVKRSPGETGRCASGPQARRSHRPARPGMAGGS